MELLNSSVPRVTGTSSLRARIASLQSTEAGVAPEAPGFDIDTGGYPTQIDTPQGRVRLHWNAGGQLADVLAQDGQRIAHYLYDAQGRRVAKQSKQGIEYFFFDGTRLAATSDADGHITGEYAYRYLRPLAWFRRDDRTFPQHVATLYRLGTDQRGALQSVQDEKGYILWRLQLDRWGQLQNHAPKNLDPRLRLIAQYADEETGLSYHLARYYDPAAGRFLSPDPAGIADSLDNPGALKLDLTAYAGGWPDLFVDPTGAAKLTYYAIDDGVPVDPDLMPDSGHWAFIVTDIATAPGRAFFYDQGGTYVRDLEDSVNGAPSRMSSNNFDVLGNHYGLTDTTPSLVTLKKDFEAYYKSAGGYYSTDAFSMQWSDEDAMGLIYAVTGENLGTQCGGYTLPTISLGVQGTLDPQSDNTIDPNRIVACEKTDSADDVLEKRIQKAIEIHEVKAPGAAAATDKNCASDKYKGCAANTWNPALTPDGSGVQPASYGWVQFTPVALQTALKGLNASDRSKLGLSAAQTKAMSSKIDGVGTWYGRLVKGKENEPDPAYVNAGWAANGASFMADTGLTKRDYDRMVAFGEIAERFKVVNDKYKAQCSKAGDGRAQSDCYWNAWKKDDPAAVQNLLDKADQQLGATQVRLNPYIRDMSNFGEGRAGFQWEAIAGDAAGATLIADLSDKEKHDLLAASLTKVNMEKARKDLHLPTSGLTQEQELQLANQTFLLHNGVDKGYPPLVEPHFLTSFCLAGSSKATNGYIQLKQLQVTP
ncbi:RHS repeat domain-containing protein [Solimonas aquatica]